MHTPRIARAHAVRGQTIRLHVPHRILPIVIVPGILGSRLTDAHTGKLVWNPTGTPFGAGPESFRVDYDRLAQPAPLEPDESHGFGDRASRQRVAHIRHYDNIVGDIYGTLAEELADLSGGDFESYGVKTRVYCCGYDWRQDNAMSALRLAQVVDEALRETRAEKVILVAHSMGGLVARYYCHLLGGESRVHALFLLGSPTLGAPGAYVQLKTGLAGAYPRDLGEAFDRGDVAAATDGVVQLGATLLAGVAGLASRGDAMELFSVIYVSMCMGAGRFLGRNETRWLLRQMPSVYQLMPNGAYCHDQPHWVLFDPLATGHPPTGTMLLFPTMLETVTEATAAVLSIDEKSRAVGESLKKTYADAMTPGRALRTSERAQRNVVTLEELAQEIADAWTKMEKESDGYQAHVIYQKIRGLYDRAEECFMDCKPHDDLYRDIYTGLLDVVRERPVAAANVETALRFHDALSSGHGGGGGGGAGLVRSMLRPLLQAIGAGGDHHDGAGHGAQGQDDGPKVYMHPNTFNVFSETEPVMGGCALLPEEILSNDDSNEVHSQMLPLPIGILGDGTVPATSANPPASRLSAPFVAVRPFPGLAHASLAKSSDVIDYVGRRIDGLVRSFCAD
jgi:pimeloyl-ACP methyl ester carboxylesterase